MKSKLLTDPLDQQSGPFVTFPKENFDILSTLNLRYDSDIKVGGNYYNLKNIESFDNSSCKFLFLETETDSQSESFTDLSSEVIVEIPSNRSYKSDYFI